MFWFVHLWNKIESQNCNGKHYSHGTIGQKIVVTFCWTTTNHARIQQIRILMNHISNLMWKHVHEWISYRKETV